MELVTEENITDIALDRWSTARSPRLATVMASLIRHVHAFAREVELTEDEWMAAMQWLKACGRVDLREEFILASDVIGLSMLIIEQNHRRDPRATPSTLMGPFYVDTDIELGYGADMSAGAAGVALFIHGVVRDLEGKPLPGARLGVWQADSDGTYDVQLGVGEARLRGTYTASDHGRYCIRTIEPNGYSIPMEGPVHEVMSQTEMSHWRPAHVHFFVQAPGYRPLVTHLFKEGAPYLDNDAVFATKTELVVAFTQHPPGPTPDGGTSDEPWVEAHYDFVLGPEQ